MLEFTYYNTEKIDDLKELFSIIFVLLNDIYNETILSIIKIKKIFQIVNYLTQKQFQ